MKWLQIVALQKNFRRKCDCFFLRMLSCQTIGFLEFLSPKVNSHYCYGRENQNNSACQSNQALIEKFGEDIDFMSSDHFYRISLMHFDRSTKNPTRQLNLLFLDSEDVAIDFLGIS